MQNTSYIALSHMTALRRQMEMIANNVANANTTGYKAEKPMFTAYLNEDTKGQKISFVQDFGMVRNLQQGALQPTGNPLDMGINGEGFFTILSTDGQEYYSRNGQFMLNEFREIVTKDGYFLLGIEGLPIEIPEGATEIIITPQGTIETNLGQAGQLELVTFEDLRELRKMPNSLYQTNQRPVAVEGQDVRQGMVEGSNVIAVIEMTRMIDVARSYEAVQRFVQVEDERTTKAIRMLSGANA